MSAAESCALGTPGGNPAVGASRARPSPSAPASRPAAERVRTGPDARARLRIIQGAASVAIVGASPNPARSSYFVATYLQQSSPYRVYFVNPRATEILGQPVYPDLASLPEVPDIVDVFRRAEDLPGVAEEAVAVGAKVLWAQLGLWSEEAADIAEAGGLEVVMDRCLKIEHARFHGGLHLMGFNTGQITSRRTLR